MGRLLYLTDFEREGRYRLHRLLLGNSLRKQLASSQLAGKQLAEGIDERGQSASGTIKQVQSQGAP
jgi:hypothetical protein